MTAEQRTALQLGVRLHSINQRPAPPALSVTIARRRLQAALLACPGPGRRAGGEAPAPTLPYEGRHARR